MGDSAEFCARASGSSQHGDAPLHRPMRYSRHTKFSQGPSSGRDGGGCCGSFAATPPARLFRATRRWLHDNTPEDWYSFGSLFESCGGFLTRYVGVGLEADDKARARRDAALVTHVATVLIALELGHAALLGYHAHRRNAALWRRRHRQAQRQQHEHGAQPDREPVTTGSEPWTRIGSSANVSAHAAAAGERTRSSPDTEDAASPHDSPSSPLPQREQQTASPMPRIHRGRRLAVYWSLVEAAVQAGKRKAPSAPISLGAIHQYRNERPTRPDGALSMSMSATAAAAALSGSNPEDSGDSLMVLPYSFSFALNARARRWLADGASADTASGATSATTTPTSTKPPTSSQPETLPSSESKQAWLTLYLLWTDTVRYTVNTDEIRKLLMSYPESFYQGLADAATASDGRAVVESDARSSRRHESDPTVDATDAASPVASARELQEAAANLALAWRLTLTRRVYDALMVHEDTQRCADDIEELKTYERDIYRRCIAPWQSKEDDAVCRHARRTGLTSLLASPSSTPTVSHQAPLPADKDGGAQERLKELIHCAPPRAWLHLTLALQQLQRLSRSLTIRSVGSLFRYMYASSKSKYLAGAMLAGLTALTSRVTSAGMRAREAAAQILGHFYYDESRDTNRDVTHGIDGGRTEGGCRTRQQEKGHVLLLQMLSLCSFELIRLTTNAILVHTSKQFISVTASQRRDAVKAQLYAALTHMPLSFFDLHSYDEIEEMVYYVNDLEGVDVHVHQYAFTAVTTFASMRLALAPLPKQARVLVFGTVAGSYIIQSLGAAVAKAYHHGQQRCEHGLQDRATPPSAWRVMFGSLMGVQTQGNTGPDDLEQREGHGNDEDLYIGVGESGGGAEDAQEAENVSSANTRDGIMLRGLEIIAALPQLRPYGADVSLMTWWNRYVTVKTYGRGGTQQGGVFGVLLRDSHGQLAPALGNALLTFADWFLPLFTSVYGAHTATCPQDAGPATASGRLLDATNAVKASVEAAVDVRRILDVVLNNGYKACVIERILSPRFWESTAAEDIDRVCTYASAHSWDDAVLRPPPVALYRRLTLQHADTLRAARAAAHSTATYENLMVTKVSVCGLQFAYPSNPTVPVFARPFNAEMRLQDPRTGKGRLVCLTGPSGHGKSTMLQLLLGLYTNYSRVSGEDALASFARPFASPIELRLAYKGSVSAPHPTPPAEDFPSDNHDGTGRAASTQTATSTVEEDYTVSLRDVPCGVLRGQLFSYVPQYPTIFAGATIAHNISLSPYISLEETALLAKVQACADEAKCDYIQRFPQGLLTPVGDASSMRGGASSAGPSDGGGLVRLSGGQAQRLMVARALFHGGGILLMDEPTASLDTATKTELLKEWRQLLNRGVIKGIICATHDEAVMAVADEVVSLVQDEAERRKGG